MKVTKRDTCRICDNRVMPQVFSLGEQYVSNFVDRENICNGKKVPLNLMRCEHCTLVQLQHTVHQNDLYSQQYWYRSGTTETMRHALATVVTNAKYSVLLEKGDIVLDIGSNDGTLLRNYPIDVLKVGVEPAKNLHEEGSKGLYCLIGDFWSSSKYYNSIGDSRAKVVTACGMFYDLEDPNQFIRDVAEVLHKDGVFIAQLMCLKNTVDMFDVGNFAHEHIEHYSFKSLKHLYEKHGLTIYDIHTNSVNGRSYLIFACHTESLNSEKINKFDNHQQRMMRVEEDEQMLDDPTIWTRFMKKLETNRDECLNYLDYTTKVTDSVYAYGASTKGNVILQYYGLSSIDIVAAIDISPEKVGKYMVGSGIPIIHRDSVPEECTHMLVLPYAFRREFINKEKAWMDNGGKMIIPLPEFEVITTYKPPKLANEPLANIGEATL